VDAAKRETKSKLARRLVEYLAQNGPTSTPQLARECSIGNLSDTASKIRPALERRGWTITATLPRRPIRNRFGEPTQAHIWRLEAMH
jgi:hypothetical protein